MKVCWRWLQIFLFCSFSQSLFCHFFRLTSHIYICLLKEIPTPDSAIWFLHIPSFSSFQQKQLSLVQIWTFFKSIFQESGPGMNVIPKKILLIQPSNSGSQELVDCKDTYLRCVKWRKRVKFCFDKCFKSPFFKSLISRSFHAWIFSAIQFM